MEIKRNLFSYIKPNIFPIFYLIFYFILFPKVKSTGEDIVFIQATTLKNGNLFIIEKNYTYIYINIYDKNWNEIVRIDIDNNIGGFLSKDEIIKFTEDNFDLIITVIKDKIYIFNNTGQNIYNNGRDLYGNYYNIIPIKKNESENTYTYAVASAQNDNLKLMFFIYNKNNQSNTLKHNITDIKFENQILQLQDTIFSCQLMSQLNKNESIVCFYQTNINSRSLLGVFYVNSKNFSITFQRNISLQNPIKFLKSVVNYEKNKSLICFGSDENMKSNCTIYSFENDTFSASKEYDIHCSWDYSLSKFYYIKETNEFLFYCADNEYVSLARFNKYFNDKGNNNTFKLSGYNNIQSLPILYFNNSGYYIISYSAQDHFKINKLDINININDNNDNIEISSTTKNHNSEVPLMTSSLNSLIINENLSYNINTVDISPTSTSYNLNFSTDEYSIEETPSNNKKNISSSITIDSIEILPSNSFIIKNSHYILNSTSIIIEGTVSSTHDIKEDTIDIEKKDLINKLDNIIDKIEIGKKKITPS